jgi:hypothetical protein
MKKTLLALLAFCSFIATSSAQIDKVEDVETSLRACNKDTVAWIHGGFLIIGMNEGLLHNWAAGGELASLTTNGIFSGYITRLHHRTAWSNNLDLNYGLQYNYSSGFVPRKTDDRIDFTSKYGYKLKPEHNLFFTALFNFRSQFTKGYNYNRLNWRDTATSAFLSPAYLTLGLGLEYRKGSDLSLFLSPVSGRLTLVDKKYTTISFDGAYGVPYGESSKMQVGAYFSGRYIAHLSERMTYKTRLDLYSNYLAKDRTGPNGELIKDNPGNIDVFFDNLFAWKASKILAIAIGLTFVYDNDIPYRAPIVAGVKQDEPAKGLGWLQMKQIFTFGLEYKF